MTYGGWGGRGGWGEGGGLGGRAGGGGGSGGGGAAGYSNIAVKPGAFTGVHVDWFRSSQQIVSLTLAPT